MHVLTDRNPREAACGHDGCAAVNQIRACADRRLVAVPGRLDEPEEDLLESSRIALDVGERSVAYIEVLGCLDDANLGVGEVRHGLMEELLAHCEIGINDGDEVPSADVKGVDEVASLLHLTWVRAHDVPEVVLVRQVPHLLPGRIIEHVYGPEPAP